MKIIVPGVSAPQNGPTPVCIENDPCAAQDPCTTFCYGQLCSPAKITPA